LVFLLALCVGLDLLVTDMSDLAEAAAAGTGGGEPARVTIRLTQPLPSGLRAAWRAGPAYPAAPTPTHDNVSKHSEGAGTSRQAAQRAADATRLSQAPRREQAAPGTAMLVAAISTTAESPENIRRWIAYHRRLGVARFYLFVTGTAALPGEARALEQEPGVVLYRPQHDEQLQAEQAKSRLWHVPWMKRYMHKPCNHELFVAQTLNMETALRAAHADNVTWVMHIDTDELLYPSGKHGFSIQEALASIPEDVDNLVMPNYEAAPETHTVVDPFREVTLFKKSVNHVIRETMKAYTPQMSKGNPNYFLTYSNGKSVARVTEDIRPNGAHRFAYYKHKVKEWAHPSVALLHFPYTRFRDLRGRRDRCDCVPVEEDAKRCFVMNFDRQAFIQASLLREPDLLQWYREHVVFENVTQVEELQRAGLMQRIHLPQSMFEIPQR